MSLRALPKLFASVLTPSLIALAIASSAALSVLTYYVGVFSEAYDNLALLLTVHKAWRNTVVIYGGVVGAGVGELGRLMHELIERIKRVEGVLFVFAIHDLGDVSVRIDSGLALVRLICVSDPAALSLMPNPFLPFSLKEGRLPEGPGEALVAYSARARPGLVAEIETPRGVVKLIVPELRLGDTLALTIPVAVSEFLGGQEDALPLRPAGVKLVNVTLKIVGVATAAPLGPLSAGGPVTLLAPCGALTDGISVGELIPYLVAVLVGDEPGPVIERALEEAKSLGLPLRRAEAGTIEPLTVFVASAASVPIEERAAERAGTCLALALLLSVSAVAAALGPQAYALTVLRSVKPLLVQAGVSPWLAPVVVLMVGYVIVVVGLVLQPLAATMVGDAVALPPALLAALLTAPCIPPLACAVEEVVSS